MVGRLSSPSPSMDSGSSPAATGKEPPPGRWSAFLGISIAVVTLTVPFWLVGELATSRLAPTPAPVLSVQP